MANFKNTEQDQLSPKQKLEFQLDSLERRNFLKHSSAMAFLAAGSIIPTAQSQQISNWMFSSQSLKEIGPLQSPDALGIRLPAGFSSRKVAASGRRVKKYDGNKTDYSWHTHPDGGACFAQADGGWIYVSNSEVSSRRGGVGAIVFDQDARIIDAYRILSKTNRNCAGGTTPWGTWLSCEETSLGAVYECDPTGKKSAKKRSALGYFKHEAVACDPVHQHLYLTEDTSNGCFYRYTPSGLLASGAYDLDYGTLEVAVVDFQSGQVYWRAVPNPTPGSKDKKTRRQIKSAAKFKGGEGIWYHEGLIYFTTKKDNKVWRYDTRTHRISTFYDRKKSSNPILSGVDNLTVTPDGHVLVAEDDGNMQIVVLGPYGDVYPLLQIPNQQHSEITGPCLNPYGNRLYFSSQRGPKKKSRGITYEIKGPFQ